MDLNTEKTVLQSVKYIAFAITSLISIYSLGKETHNKDKNELTPAGRTVRKMLVLSVVVTLFSMGFENRVDDKLKNFASAEGDQKFVTHLQENNDTVLNKIYTEQRKETDRTLNDIRDSSKTLQQALAPLLPLNSISLEVDLSDWVRTAGKTERPTGPAVVGKRPETLRSLEIGSDEWNRVVCSNDTPEHKWQMSIPITAHVSVDIAPPRDASNTEACELRAKVRVNGEELHFGTKSRTYGYDFAVRAEIERNALKESQQRQFHRRAITPYQDETVLEILLPRGQEYDVILPRNISVEVIALPEGADSIQRKILLTLDPRPTVKSWKVTFLYYPSGGKRPHIWETVLPVE